MGLRILKLYVKGIEKALSTYTKVSDWLNERKSIDMEMNCPADCMFPQIFSQEGTVISKCPYGEMRDRY